VRGKTCAARNAYRIEFSTPRASVRPFEYPAGEPACELACQYASHDDLEGDKESSVENGGFHVYPFRGGGGGPWPPPRK